MENPKQVLIYDIKSFPADTGLDMEKVIYLYMEHGIIFYDSSYGGDKPEVMNIKDMDVVFKDVSKEENMKALNNYKEKLK